MNTPQLPRGVQSFTGKVSRATYKLCEWMGFASDIVPRPDFYSYASYCRASELCSGPIVHNSPAYTATAVYSVDQAI